MESNDVFTRIKALGLKSGEYVVVSGGVLAAHGIRDASDIDIVVLPEIYSRFKKLGWKEIIKHNGLPFLETKGYEMTADWYYNEYRPDIKKIFSEAETIGGCTFSSLEEVVEFKKAINREKDREDIKKIEEYWQKHNH